MQRRYFLRGLALGTLCAFGGLLPRSSSASGVTQPASLDVPASEWRALLSTAQYRVLFEEGTEPPFSSPLNEQKGKGTYVCAACYLPLFESATKYDSGTGWPSFFDVMPGHVGTSTDFKLIFPRTEYHCARCGGHQGHVFEDGPQPTGLRYCNNGIALRFVAEGDPLPELRRPS